MRTQLRSIITTAAVAVVVSLGVVGCSSSKPKTVGDVTTLPATATTVASGNAVTIKGFAFGPTPLTVKDDTTVTWTNKDGFAHTATSNSGPAKFNSGQIQSHKSFSFKFTKPGTYHYICAIHNYMSGTIVVTK